MAASEQLQAMLAPVVEGLGYVLWGLEYVPQGKHSVLRVFIDHENGILVEDCEKVSRQISGVLDVEDPIRNEYMLEVSSPGMDRPLFTLEHFQAYAGERVEIRLRSAFEGKRKFKGHLVGVEGDEVVLRVGEEEVLFPVQSIDKANLVAAFDFKK